jgi:hypothetical protein
MSAMPCHNIPEFCDCAECRRSRAEYKAVTGKQLASIRPHIGAILLRSAKPDPWGSVCPECAGDGSKPILSAPPFCIIMGHEKCAACAGTGETP